MNRDKPLSSSTLVTSDKSSKPPSQARSTSVDRARVHGSSAADHHSEAPLVTGHTYNVLTDEARGVKRSSVSESGQARRPVPSNRKSLGIGSALHALNENLDQIEHESPVKKILKTTSRPTGGHRSAQEFIESLVNGSSYPDFKHMDEANVRKTVKFLNIECDDSTESHNELRAKLITYVREQLTKKLTHNQDTLNLRIAKLGLSSPSPLKKSLDRMVQRVRSPTVLAQGQQGNNSEQPLFRLHEGRLYCPQLWQEGNTCFVNQGLVSLLSLPTFQKLIIKHSDKPGVAQLVELARLKPEESIGSTEELRQWMTRFNLKTKQQNTAINYMDGRQHDVAEFLNDLMDFLTWNPDDTVDTTFADMEVELRTLFRHTNSSVFKCMSNSNSCSLRQLLVCHYPSTSVSITEGHSLQECWDSDGKYIEWKCNNCSTEECKRWSHTANDLPNVWIIQLKRFDKNAKLETEIDIPQMWQPYGPSSAAYVLRAVTIHRGWSRQGGHYIGLTIDRSGQLAYKMDDHHKPVKVKCKNQ